MIAFLKYIFFLMDRQYDKRIKLVGEGFVKSAVRFTSDMDEKAIFSTIRVDKFDGDVSLFKDEMQSPKQVWLIS